MYTTKANKEMKKHFFQNIMVRLAKDAFSSRFKQAVMSVLGQKRD